MAQRYKRKTIPGMSPRKPLRASKFLIYHFRFSSLTRLLPGSSVAARAMLVVNDMHASSWCNYRAMHSRGLEPDTKMSFKMWTVRMCLMQLNEAMPIVNQILDDRSKVFGAFPSATQSESLIAKITPYRRGGPKHRLFKERVMDVRNQICGHWKEQATADAIQFRSGDPTRDITSIQLGTKPWHTHFQAADDFVGSIILRGAWGIPNTRDDANDIFNREIKELMELADNVGQLLFRFIGWYLLSNGLTSG